MSDSLEEHYIYALVDPRDNLEKYIGKTKNLQRRFQGHLQEAKKKNSPLTRKNNWLKSLFKKDLLPIIKVIETCTSDSIDQREVFWITHYSALRGSEFKNMTEGGTGGTTHHGRPVKIYCSNGKMYESIKNAAEDIGCSRSAIALVLKGKNYTARGLTFWRPGEYQPEPHIKNVPSVRVCCSNGNTYRSIEEAALALNICSRAISLAVIGKKRHTAEGYSFWRPGESPRSDKMLEKEVMCITTGDIFNNLKEAAGHFKIHISNLRKVLLGQRAQVSGLVFKYTGKLTPRSK